MIPPAKDRLLGVDAGHNLDAFAARDAQPDEGHPLPPRRSRSVRDGGAVVRALAAEPRWSWGIPVLDRIAPVRMGYLVYVIGATGRGKSALLLQVARAHATDRGPAIVFSAELSFGVACGRLASQRSQASWLEVLDGGLDDDALDRALDVPRLRIADDLGPSWPQDIENEIAHAARDHPGEPVLIAVDYLQILKGPGRDPRERVASASTALREIAVRTGAVVVCLAKAGRVAAKGLRAGELVGVDATEAGAETNSIEQDAFVQLQLGAMRPAVDHDVPGCQIVDLSVSKARFGTPDLVVPLLFDGARGWFHEHGEPVSAAEHRAAVRGRTPRVDAAAVARRVRDALQGLGAGSRNEIARAAGGTRAAALAALDDLLGRGEVVEVQGTKSGGRWPLALADQLTRRGLRAIDRGCA